MKLIDIEGLPSSDLAELLVIGCFQPAGLRALWDERPFQPIADQLRQIEQRWAPKAAKGYFPGPVARVTRAEVSQGTLILSMQPTTFKEYIGLRSDEDRTRFGQENLANPLSVSLVVRTSDEKYLLTQKRRGDRIGAIDAVGGYVNPEKDAQDPAKTVLREWQEETGAKPEDIVSWSMLGLCYEHKDLNHPVLNCFVQSKLTANRHLEIAPKNADGEVQLLSVDDPLRAIEQFRREEVDIEPDGQMSYALAVAYLFDPTSFSSPRQLKSV